MRLWTCALLFAACLAQSGCRPPPTSSAVARACPSELALPHDLVAAGTTLILGEMHGTREIPQFTADLACHVLARGQRLVLALEIPASEQTRIDQFLASPGDVAARAALVAGEYWTFPMQDGRRSQAMLDLLAAAQRWAHDKAPIEVVAFDAEVPPAERDAAMAELLAAARRTRPGAFFLVLTGGVHATRQAAPDFEPMAVHFEKAAPPHKIVSLAAAHAGGTAWVCTEECGPHEIAGQAPTDSSGVALFERPKAGFDGQFYVGQLHASPPVVSAH